MLNPRAQEPARRKPPIDEIPTRTRGRRAVSPLRRAAARAGLRNAHERSRSLAGRLAGAMPGPVRVAASGGPRGEGQCRCSGGCFAAEILPVRKSGRAWTVVISEKSGDVWNRRPGLVGLRLRIAMGSGLEQIDRVTLGEGATRPAPTRTETARRRADDRRRCGVATTGRERTTRFYGFGRAWGRLGLIQGGLRSAAPRCARRRSET